jgi:hypothetical protein
MGHLGGLVAGYLYVLGMLNVLMLSPAMLNWLESLGCMGSLMTIPGYVVNPNLGLPTLNRGATYVVV